MAITNSPPKDAAINSVEPTQPTQNPPFPTTQSPSRQPATTPSAAANPANVAPQLSTLHIDINAESYPSPAATTSAVHAGPVDAPVSPPRTRMHNPMLDRFLTVHVSESPIRHEAGVAIKLGLVREGENMYERRMRERLAELGESGEELQ